MCEKLYEIHILEKKKCNSDFYVIELQTGRHYAKNEWPPNFEQLGCNYLNEHCDFVIDSGYDPVDVKSCFVDIGWLYKDLKIFIELTDVAENREMKEYHDRLLRASIGADYTGNYSSPTFYHPKKK